MKGLLKVLACLVFAYANVVASYNPYAYNARFAPQLEADSYSSMGDVDWGKRSYNPYSYFSRPSSSYSADSYSSMGDVNWAKRSYDEPLIQALSEADDKRSPSIYQRSYKYRQPYMKANPSKDAAYLPYAFARPQTRNSLGERQYSFGMADMDWGWKKRSQWPAYVDIEDLDIPDEDLIDNPKLEKKNLAALAQTNMFPKNHKLYGKRSEDYEPDEGIEENKRNIASIVRAGRSVQSLVRDGGIRNKNKA